MFTIFFLEDFLYLLSHTHVEISRAATVETTERSIDDANYTR